MSATGRAVTLAKRPQGVPAADDFEIARLAVADPPPGSLLVRVEECSLDPAMRRWMDEDSYGRPIALGAPIPTMVLGRVVASRCEGIAVGDAVTGRGAIAEYAIVPCDGYTRVVDAEGLPSLSCHLSVLGTSGLTAYNGLLKVGRPEPGQTVLVSAAAGSVGSIVGQIARLVGCRAVGIAGGGTKCRWLTERYGFDAAIDYRGLDANSITQRVRDACPRGVDVYFDNVGGACLEAALACINPKARIVLCGMIAQYNATEAPCAPRNLWQLVARTASMHGFLNRFYLDDCTEELRQLKRWIEEGRLTWREQIEVGIENFHGAFMRLFDGRHDGKLILRIAPAG